MLREGELFTSFDSLSQIKLPAKLKECKPNLTVLVGGKTSCWPLLRLYPENFGINSSEIKDGPRPLRDL